MPLNRFGWRHDPAGVERAVQKFGLFSDRATEVIRDYKQVDTYLSDSIIWCDPSWEQGAQEIGDCTSWGAALAATSLVAEQAVFRKNRGIYVPVASEAFYGLGRVEVEGKSFDSWEDGSTGFAMARAATEFGVLFRKDYSKITGNPEHDLRQYSGERAKNWGYYGCGGQHDKGALDKLATEHPCQDKAQVKGWDDVAAAIAGARCPVMFASTYGCSMKRDKYGYCRWDRTWYHLMAALDVRFGSHPGVRIFQSWGPRTVTGPSGDEYCVRSTPTPQAILNTSWWAPPEDVDKICKTWGGDSWALSPVKGFKIPVVDAGGAWA